MTLILAIYASCLAPSLHADGLIRDGMGAITVGRGGTNLGFADNGVIIHDNPAAMTNIRGTRLLEAGIDAVVTDLHYVDPGANVKGNFNIYPSGVLGMVHRQPDGPFAYGFGIYAPAGFGARFEMDNPHFGRTRYNSIGMLSKFLPAAAVQLTEDTSFGAAVGVAVGHVELEGPFYTQTGPMAGMPSLFDLQGTDAALAWNIGLQHRISDSTWVGLAYTEETRFEFEGSANATLLTPAPIVSDFDANTELVWPRSIGLGIQHRAASGGRFGFDFYWYDWSSAYSNLPLRLSNPSNPALGGATITDSFPFNWRDTYSFRFGYEWNSSPRHVWRTGYIYHRSPAPDSTLNPYTDGVLEHALSIGHSCMTRYGVLNLAYQASWGPTRRVGASAIVGNDFDNSEFTATAHWFTISILR